MTATSHGLSEQQLQLADVRRRLKAIFIGSVGNLVEWYDFYAYAAFALYFASSFFPGGDPVVQQLNAAVLFAIGFIVRPIGGWLFGHLADHYGRRNALMLSVLLMCFGSLMIASPTYASIGIGAPALLGAARIVQGLSLGGEYGASATSQPSRLCLPQAGVFAAAAPARLPQVTERVTVRRRESARMSGAVPELQGGRAGRQQVLRTMRDSARFRLPLLRTQQSPAQQVLLAMRDQPCSARNAAGAQGGIRRPHPLRRRRAPSADHHVLRYGGVERPFPAP
jgi:hypothetical protein